MGNKRDAILDALENLTVTEFKKFKLKLGSVQLRQGFRTIPRGVLGPLDAMDLTDKLIAFYCEDYGAELTAAVLCDMGMQQEAAQLQGIKTDKVGSSGVLSRSEPGLGGLLGGGGSCTLLGDHGLALGRTGEGKSGRVGETGPLEESGGFEY